MPMQMTPEIVLAIFAIALVLVLARALQFRLDGFATRVATLSRIEAKLDLLLKQAGLEYDPYKDAPASVVEAVRRGRKIEAIKCYRKLNPVSLKEAKEYVEGVQRRAGIV
jgi:hypothetical protein